MVNDDAGTLRAIAWSEICPWLRLFRCFGLAIRPRLLFLGAVAILLTVTGWALLGKLFSGDASVKAQVAPYGGCPWLALTALVPDRPTLPDLDLGFAADQAGLDFTADSPDSIFDRPEEPFWGSFVHLSRPFRAIFASDVTVTRLAFLLLCGLWTLAVWGFFGGAISRCVAVELASEERVSWGAMMRHARSKWRSYFAAPLVPLVPVLVAAAFMGVAGMLLWLDVGLLLAALLWPLAIATGLVMAWALLGLVFGWPLMWATIGTEATDCFDAVVRAYQYLFQRPLHYLFYAVVAVLIGVLGWLVVANFAAGSIAVTSWAVDWGANTGRWLGLPEAGSRRLDLLLSGGDEVGLLHSLGRGLIIFWFGCIKVLAVGFLYSYFWTASTCIYSLLRYDADATELDEVYLEEEEEEAADGLPPIRTDEAGAPVVADDTEPPQKEPGPSEQEE